MMDKRELEMYRIEDIVRDLIDQVPIKQIARIRKVSKNTVKKYFKLIDELQAKMPDDKKSDAEMLCQQIRTIRKTEKYSANFLWLSHNDPYVRELSGNCSNIIVLYQKLQDHGFIGSYSSLVRYITKINTVTEKPVIRMETKPGEYAQVDFGSIGTIYDPEQNTYVKAYVFAMVLSYSRDAYYEIVTSQNIETWCSCHVHSFEYFGAVPSIIMPDNLKSAVIKTSFLEPVANRSYADCATHYGFQIYPCLPETPQHKGKVESGVKYVKNNFLPLRTFKDIHDANAQLREWNTTVARERIHGTTRQKPAELFDIVEKKAMKPVNNDRFELAVWKHLKVYRDIHIQFDKNYYSVPYRYIGEMVWVRKTASQISIFFENELVAIHTTLHLSGKRKTNRDHYPPDSLRYIDQDQEYCLDKSRQIGSYCFALVSKLLDEEPAHHLRAAQNMIRLAGKYGDMRVNDACFKALTYGNYSYRSVKIILEQGLENDLTLFEDSVKTQLSDTYARDLQTMIMENIHGNISAT